MVLCWAALAAFAALPGCADWLDMPGPDPATDAAGLAARAPGSRRGVEVGLPHAGPRVDGKGPIVPRTPGLRVPEGYFTRVRLDEADLLLPYTWVSVEDTLVYEAAGPRSVLTLRVSASEAALDGVGRTGLRGVLRVAVPPGTSLEGLAGLSLGEDALVGSTLSVAIHRDTTSTRCARGS